MEAYGATFTEILTSTTRLSQTSDDQAGEYTLSQSGSNSANFVDDGTDADGTFHVTEGSAGSFSSDTLGDSNNADYTITATTSTGYSYSETLSGTVALHADRERLDHGHFDGNGRSSDRGLYAK